MSNGTFVRAELIEITVVCCNNLRDTSTRWRHDQDPYVKLEYANSSYRTQVCKAQGKDPVFGQKFELPIVEGHYEIKVEVWNRNVMESDYLIGTARVLIDMVLLGGSDDSVWPLQFKDRHAGHIRLIMKYQKMHIMSNTLSLSADFGHLQPAPYRSFGTTNYVPNSLYPFLESSLPLPVDPIVPPPSTNRSTACSRTSAPSAQSFGDYNSTTYGSHSQGIPKNPSSFNSSTYILPSEPSLYSRPGPELINPTTLLNSSSLYATSDEHPFQIPPHSGSPIPQIAPLNSLSCVASTEPSLNSRLTPELLKRPTSLNSSTYIGFSEPKSCNPSDPEAMRQPISVNSSSCLVSSEAFLNSTTTQESQKQLESMKSSAYMDTREPVHNRPSTKLQCQSRSLDSASLEAKTEHSSDTPSSEFVNHLPLSPNSSSYVATSESYSNPPTPHVGSLSILHNSQCSVTPTYQDGGDGIKEERDPLSEQRAERSRPLSRKRARTSRISYQNEQYVHEENDSKDINSKSGTTHSLDSTAPSPIRVLNLSVCKQVMIFMVCFFFWFLVYLKVGYQFRGLTLFR